MKAESTAGVEKIPIGDSVRANIHLFILKLYHVIFEIVIIRHLTIFILNCHRCDYQTIC